MPALQVVQAGKRLHGLRIKTSLVYAVRCADAAKSAPLAERGHPTTRLRKLIEHLGAATTARVLYEVLQAQSKAA